jgi:hypothetical protein
MTDNQRRILEMLAAKKISVEEAERLLALTGQPTGGETGAFETAQVQKPKPKYLRVVVTPPKAENGSEARTGIVNVRVPLTLIRAGLKLRAFIPPDKADQVNEALRSKGLDFDVRNIRDEDLEQLVDALSDLEVEVSDEEGAKAVRIYVE